MRLSRLLRVKKYWYRSASDVKKIFFQLPIKNKKYKILSWWLVSHWNFEMVEYERVLKIHLVFYKLKIVYKLYVFKVQFTFVLHVFIFLVPQQTTYLENEPRIRNTVLANGNPFFDETIRLWA